MKKMERLLKILFFFIFLTVFTNCERDPLSEQQNLSTDPGVLQVIPFKQLPVSIQSEITATAFILKSASYAGKAFGEVVQEKIHQLLKPDGTSYTLALSRTEDGFYYDNLVINEDGNGALTTHIVRYQPEISWFAQHKTEGWGYETYSGTMTVFGETGEMLSSVTLTDGVPQKETVGEPGAKAVTEYDCEVLDVQYVGGCAGEDYCWWNEVIITVDCTEAGGGFEDDGMSDGFDTGGVEDGQSGGGGGLPPVGSPDPIDTVPVDDTIEDTVMVSPDNPISNIEDYLECFDLTQGATVTIYVDQPVANSSIVASVTDKAGHAFISISQNGNTSVFGFYPVGSADPFFNYSQTSVMGNDNNGNYDVSISTAVDATTLQSVLNYSLNYPATYNLYTYNCTDFVIEIGNILGMDLPDCYSNFGTSGGSNPAALGQYIRNDFNSDGTYLINENGGNAPSNNKGC